MYIIQEQIFPIQEYRANLPYTGIQTNFLLTDAIQYIDAKLAPAEIVAAVIEAIEADDTLRAALCTALNC